MDISHHGTDVTRAVGRFAAFWVLEGVEILDDGLVEVFGVALVEGVNLAASWQSDLKGDKWCQNA